MIHDDAIEWISEKEGLKINHWGAAEKTFRINGKIPDLVGSKGEIHEVETINLKESKIDTYTKLNRPKTLWLVFENNPLMAFDYFHLIYKADKGFKKVTKPPKLIKKKISDALSNLGDLLNKQCSLKQNIKELEKKKQEFETQIASLEKDKQFYVEQKIGQGRIAIMRVSSDTFKRCLPNRLPNKIEVIGE